MLYAIQGVDDDATGPTLEFLLHTMDFGIGHRRRSRLLHAGIATRRSHRQHEADQKDRRNAIDAHRKELIPEILAIVLMVIPFVGKALGPLICSATSIARIALLVGEMGNGGPTVAALFAILGLIAGVDSGTGKLSKGRPW
ncbi:hypothetical protein N7489_003891 [Penicillium chrysogenum]|jgi:hypothetical protein|uniref:uncharacterized protein n=1 Tax=Penicillium chrysogenum TaxID=5076 RepID=UPI0024DF20F4|nr:uncharacterized protein N7489_003891 [Penicillium chrysogenum]KAJ5243795.1 hypothetical protein N7489_003891 [Penicillium chrysogenum]KAJ6140873.1 hypothetical protein N7497_011766 [Penicillium chrysogenum]